MNVISNPEETKEYFKQLQIQSYEYKKAKSKYTALFQFLKRRGFSKNEAFDIMYANK